MDIQSTLQNNLLMGQLQRGSSLQQGHIQKSLFDMTPEVDLGRQSQTGDLLGTFKDTLQQELNKVNQAQVASEDAINTYASGGNIELHNVVLAATKAEMSMELAVAMRNKLVAAYQEISHMQI